MDLKELRLSKKLTQAQAALKMGISLRSYKQYENDKKKINTIKYNYMIRELEKVGYIDEEHGILNIEIIKSKTANIFKKHEVEYCILFGSYANGTATEKSDVDLLVASNVTGMDFYGMAEELREALQKKVDLLNLEQLYNNQNLLNNILKDGIKIYG